jgi:hypothetical protein
LTTWKLISHTTLKGPRQYVATAVGDGDSRAYIRDDGGRYPSHPCRHPSFQGRRPLPGKFSVGGIRNQAFRIPKIKECLQSPKFLCERPSGETPGALESIFVFQSPSFDQYPSSPAEPPNELRITQGVRVSVRLIVFFCDETPETNFAHPDSLGLGFAWGVSSSLTSNNFKFECDPCLR